MEEQFRSNLPIYLQLMERIKEQIVSGELQPGQRLVPVRELAQTFEVNPNTMQRALSELEREGLMYTERTAGRFITQDEQLIAQTREALAVGRVDSFLAQMRALGYSQKALAELIETRLREQI